MRSFIAAFVGFLLGAIAAALIVVVIDLTMVEPARKPGSEFDALWNFLVVSAIVLILSFIGGVLGAFSSMLLVYRNNRG